MPGPRREYDVEVAERDRRAGERRTHDPQRQRVGRGDVVAEPLGAFDLGAAVDPRDAGTDGVARRGLAHDVAARHR